MMNRRADMQQAVELLRRHLSFDKDIKVHVFETIIRVLGGLTSGHVLIEREPFLVPGYDGLLLKLVSAVRRVLSLQHLLAAKAVSQSPGGPGLSLLAGGGSRRPHAAGFRHTQRPACPLREPQDGVCEGGAGTAGIFGVYDGSL